MFRPIRRKKREISIDSARELLLCARRGVLAVNGDDGYPYAVPINYIFDSSVDKIYFHGARAGHKYDSIKRDDRICFTVTGKEIIKEEAWAPYLQSVVVFGRCRMIEDQDEAMNLVRKLASKYYPNNDLIEEEVQQSGKGVQMFEITIEHISGKQVQEK